MARSLIGIGALDSLIQDQEQIAKFVSIKDFRVMLWRHPIDETGSNSDARSYRIQRDGSNDSSWWCDARTLRRGATTVL